MTLLREIASELLGMFLADARLTSAIVVLVLIVAGLVRGASVEPLIGGGVLLAGSLVILVVAAAREARNKK